MNSFTPRLVAALVLLLVGTVQAAPTGQSPEVAVAGPVNPLPGVSMNDLSGYASLQTTLALTEEGVQLAQATTPDFGGDVFGFKPKSPRRAFLQSLVVPGWGQWYNGSRIKPFVFLGLEAAGWYFWSDFRGSGNDLEDQYRTFADELVDDPRDLTRWDFEKYINGLQVVYGIEADTIPYVNPEFFEDPSKPQFLVFSHHVLPSDTADKSDTYYENIGKYDQFAFGWYDYNDGEFLSDDIDTAGVPIVSPDRRSYVGQRDDANREFNKASTVLILTIGNHLLSAFEAAIGAKRYNRSRDQFGAIDADLRLTQTSLSTELAPRLTLRYHF